MSRGPCPSTEDLAAYALGALDDGEWEPVADHALTCVACHRTISEQRLAVDALAVGVAPHLPSPQLRERVMAVVRLEADVMQASGASADRAPRARRRRLSLRPAPAFAVAVALLGAGLGAGALLGGDDGVPSRTVAAVVDAPGARAELRVRGDVAQLVVDRLPAPPTGRIYQVWLERTDDRQPPRPTTALFSVDRRGRAAVSVPGDLHDVDAVLVTDEPLGGSEVPSESPVIQARLT